MTVELIWLVMFKTSAHTFLALRHDFLPYERRLWEKKI